ncbi:DNA excision repair protein ERCC-1 isoform X2 [Pieris napi]|uniref:DNA excision repair protein ERCC-1 isoform X2 n=1 Tax=Pieris napi TaxID=78633 RepID=UPI001FBA1981|nr:DNA excision repair protein ERCC-1 isoform X2 [Pieris napi]
MEEDGLDDLLAQISEPTSPKKTKQDEQPGTSKSTSKTHCVLVNQKQRGNPLLKFIVSVPWEYDEIIPDYEIGKTIGILFISVDLKDPHAALKNLTRICLLTDLTLMLAWSPEEAAKIIENYKIYENKPPDKIMEKIENDPHQKIVNALSSIKPVNKTDALTLIATFGTLENIIKATEKKLSECPGFGATKAKKLYRALHEPFLKNQMKPDVFAGNISIEDIESVENITD